MRVIIWMLLVFCLALPFSSCRLPEVKEESPSVNEVPAHHKFRINLPEDHRTGYSWTLNQDYDKTVIKKISEVWHGNDKGIDFNLESQAVGQTTLTFINRKYTDTTNVKFYIVKISGN